MLTVSKKRPEPRQLSYLNQLQPDMFLAQSPLVFACERSGKRLNGSTAERSFDAIGSRVEA